MLGARSGASLIAGPRGGGHSGYKTVTLSVVLPMERREMSRKMRWFQRLRDGYIVGHVADGEKGDEQEDDATLELKREVEPHRERDAKLALPQGLEWG